MQNTNGRLPNSHRLHPSSDRDLYTIPTYSSWFSWDDIHQNEKTAHIDFFNNSSISKTPKIYKEYRDFIINKYREEPNRRLAFTEVRKSLIGDVGSIHKVFRFLENWGLINFGVRPDGGYGGRAVEEEEEEDEEGPGLVKVVVEEGAPTGIRVAEYPNSTKALVAAPVEGRPGSGGEGFGDGVFRLPPLTSYSDVFGEVGEKKGCWNCGGDFVSGYYELVKGGSVVCATCFKNGNYKESKLADDFKFIDVDGTGNVRTDVWTDAETILLLEAVTKHGDDWNLVEQHVQTKTKIDCISRLIQLPFGDNLLRTSIVKGGDRNSINCTNIGKQMGTTSVAELQEELPRTEDQHHECEIGEAVADGQIEDGDRSGPPLKRRCINSFGDAGISLMNQVARLSTVVGPHVAATAAKAAVASLCNENPCARKFYEADADNIKYNGLPTLSSETSRVIEGTDTEMAAGHKQSGALEAAGPSTLQIRVAIATAFGAAAAHAKLLADQEEREMEHLMATIIEAQIRKIEYKNKHFEELELIMEKEYSQMQQLKDAILSDRINVLQQAFNAGISRWKDHKSLTNRIL